MVEITLSTSPGTSDVSIDGVSLDDVDYFQTECLSSGVVSCGWDTLHARLINHDISKFWWFLTEPERRSIAEMAIKNTLYYDIRYGRSGNPGCAGGEGGVGRIVCMQNGVIRTLKFGSYSVGGDSCYYRRSTSSEEFCYVTETPYGLPCHIVSCVTYAGANPGFGHTMCSIHVGEKTNSLDDWIIFQYSDFDLKPGHWQIPANEYDLYITFGELTWLSCSGLSSKKIARFDHI